MRRRSGSATGTGGARGKAAGSRTEPAARRGLGPPALAAAVLGCFGGLAFGSALTLLAPAEGPADTALPGWLLPAARTVLDATGVSTVGLTLLPLLMRGARPRDFALARSTAHRALVVAAAAWAAAAGLVLWLQVAAATATNPFAVTVRQVGHYLAAAVGGRALVVTWLCGLGIAVAAAVVTATVAVRRPAVVLDRLMPVPAFLGVLALPVTGHAATAPAHDLAVLAVAGHVAAAAAWFGGLGVVAWLASPRRELLAASLPGYSRLATACLVAVTVTGVLGAVLRLPSAVALVDTSYGWILIGKALGLLTLGLLGARARSRLLPAIQARRTARLSGWLAAELITMGTVLGLAAVLAGTAPPA